MLSLEWEVLKSKHIIKDEWLSLRVDRCRLPNGDIAEPYYIFEYPAWVNVVAFTENHEVILERQYRHGLRKAFLELPSGYAEENEPPLEAIKRELLEETGYTSNNFIETGRLSANPASHANITYCFMATRAKRIADQKLDGLEQIDVVLMPLDEVIRLIHKGDFIQALHVGSLFFALKKLGKLIIK